MGSAMTRWQCLVLLTAMLCGQVSAEGIGERRLYLGASAFIWFFANDYLQSGAVAAGFQTRAGYQATDHFGAELRYTVGGSGETDGVSARIDRAFTALATVSGEFGDNHRAGIYAGHTTAGLEIASAGSELRNTEHGITTGTFVNISVAEQVYLFVDYGTWLWDTDYVSQGFNLGLGARF